MQELRCAFALLLCALSVACLAEAPTEAQRAVELQVEQSMKEQGPPFAHAMRSPGETAQQARAKINAWIRYHFQQAFDATRKGDGMPMLIHLYMARYTLRSSVLPAANDERGDPAVLSGPLPANFGESSTRHWLEKVDEDVQAMFETAYVPTGDLLRMYGIDSANGPIDRPGQLPRPQIRKAAAPAAAPRRDAIQVDEQAGSFVLTVPVSKLSMTLPKAGLVRKSSQSGGSTDSPRYFYFEDAPRGVAVSGWFESASGSRDINKFWENETSEWRRRQMPQPKDVAFERVGNWDGVFYDMAHPGGTNSHVRAHWVQAGTWIDLHVSITSDRTSAEARAAVRAFLRSVEVKEK